MDGNDVLEYLRRRFLVLSWDDLYHDILETCRKIVWSGYKPDCLIAVARGGWVIARIVSDFLGVGEVASVGVKYYVDIGKTSEEPRLVQGLDGDLRDKNVLLVDDVADTGRTLNFSKKYLVSLGAAEVRSAVPYRKPWSRFTPDYYHRIVDKWIVFPYEQREIIESVVRDCREKYGPRVLEALKKILVEAGFDGETVEFSYSLLDLR